MFRKLIFTAIVCCSLQLLCAATHADLTLTESRAINESRTLPMPTTWIGRHDVFNVDSDFQALLFKSKVSGVLPIINNTAEPISVHISARQCIEITSELELVELDLTIAAGEMTNTPNFFSYGELKLSTESTGFLNFYSTNRRFECSIEPEPMLLFPRPLNPFSFIPDQTSNISGFAEKRQEEIQKYRGHVNFLKNYVCKQETIIPADLYLQRQRLYERFKLESIMGSSLPAIPRIPLNLFSIWLTNPMDPKEPDPQMIEIAKTSAKNNRRSDGWNYYFLVQDPALLPKTIETLEGTDIQVVKFSDLLGTLEAESEFTECLAECKFGMASDILRAEALMKMGGGYLDIDLQVFHSLKPYFYAYHSLFGVEPMSEFIGNAFMASSPNHPIMREIIRLIKRNFVTKKSGNKKFYTEISSYEELNTILQTGPCVTTVAFHNAADRDENIDIAMPPEALYPGVSLRRPEYTLPTLSDRLNLTSATLHLWTKSWLQKKL